MFSPSNLLQKNKSPLVRFERGERATVVSETDAVPKKKRKRHQTHTKNTMVVRKKKTSRKPRVIKGRLQVRVVGYSGVQKLTPASLIPYLPTNKIKAAAKKVLSRSATTKRTTTKKRKRVSKRKRRTKKRKS